MCRTRRRGRKQRVVGGVTVKVGTLGGKETTGLTLVKVDIVVKMEYHMFTQRIALTKMNRKKNLKCGLPVRV